MDNFKISDDLKDIMYNSNVHNELKTANKILDVLLDNPCEDHSLNHIDCMKLGIERSSLLSAVLSKFEIYKNK